MRKSIYLAGPMTGYPDFNFPAFYAAEKRLRKAGWTVFNPANKDDEAGLDAEAKASGDDLLAIEKGFDFREAYLWDIHHVIHADGMYLLRGWEQSSGVRGELAVAQAIAARYPEYQIIFEELIDVPSPVVQSNDIDSPPLLYVHKGTAVIYEVQPRDEYFIVRPVTPELYHDIRKVSKKVFEKDYEEFLGSYHDVYEMIGYPQEGLTVD